MPPSGFNIKQSMKVTGFLSLCLEDLISEAKDKKLSFNDAMKQEIININTIQAVEKKANFENHLLEVVKLFYSELLKFDNNNSSTFRKSGKQVLQKFTDKILDIHVPEIK